MSVDIGRKKNKNKKRTNDNDAGNPNIFCSQFGGRKDTEHCTSLKYAKKSARKFDLTPKEGFFYNYSEHGIVEFDFYGVYPIIKQKVSETDLSSIIAYARKPYFKILDDIEDEI